VKFNTIDSLNIVNVDYRITVDNNLLLTFSPGMEGLVWL